MRVNNYLFVAACAVGLSACAATVPHELLNARAANLRARNGPAAQVAPAELHIANQALAKAEQSFSKSPDSYQTADLSYVAQRKAELATATAAVITAQNRQAQAAEDYQKTQGKIIARTKDDLGQTRADLAASEQSGDRTAEQLEVERQARVSAESRLSGAMKDLAAVAAVKDETRGVVITLTGGVLFVSGKSALLNTAMTKLDQVAEALMAQDPNKMMVVEGHTDSRGSDRTNQPLSVNRATTVRDYLVSRGVDSARITAVGKGSSRPIIDNKTTENRANNRRVEIIIQREVHAVNP